MMVEESLRSVIPVGIFPTELLSLFNLFLDSSFVFNK
jgi:hypothetical protein